MRTKKLNENKRKTKKICIKLDKNEKIKGNKNKFK